MIRFLKYLLELKDKATGLRQRLFDTAADEVEALFAVLDGNKNAFMKGTIKLSQFIRNCEDVISAAREGELEYHRSAWGKILNGLLNALNVLTFGVVPVWPTDSMFKINKMSDAIESLSPRPQL